MSKKKDAYKKAREGELKQSDLEARVMKIYATVYVC